MGVTKTYKTMSADGLVYIPKAYRYAVGVKGNTVFEISVSGDTIMLKKTDKKNTKPDELTEEEKEELKKEKSELFSRSQMEKYQERNGKVKCSMCGCLSGLFKYKGTIYCDCCIKRLTNK